MLDEGKYRSITDIAAAEGIDVTQARRLLRLTLLGPVVVDNLLANPDVAINLERVLRRVMPLDWREHPSQRRPRVNMTAAPRDHCG